MQQSLTEAYIHEPSILISVNRTYQDGGNDLYKITRGDWVIGKRREKAKYAFTVYRGEILEVFSIHSWEPVTTQNPNQQIRNRWRFTGQVASEMKHYIGQGVRHYRKRGSQSPILYVNC
ncbi:MAG: hypothetical protein UZ15_CFX003000923 [Chloroflexi bacterium OLB15]|nr:MAG: hypothetical protein UZ15_CFX003000923 [Chloroflexi bacterium OLB15]